MCEILLTSLWVAKALQGASSSATWALLRSRMRPCGDGVALYSLDAMRMIKYAGAGVWFGEAGEPD